jgi:hypothetical protein
VVRFEREGKAQVAIMLPNPAHQLNCSDCKADFTYTIVLDVVKIQDTGRSEKSVTDDLKAVLRKIEDWHQGSIAGYRIIYRAPDGTWTNVEWDGSQVGFITLGESDEGAAIKKLTTRRPRK